MTFLLTARLKALMLGLALAVVALCQPAHAGEKVTVTDLAGRQVEVSIPAKTMILGEGRFLPIVAMLERKDPVARVAGMMADFQRFDAAGYAQYLKKFPHLADVPTIGHASAQSFSLEKSISVTPDVAVFGLGSGHGPGARHKSIIEKLEAAGVPVVVLDFRIDPLTNTPKSLSLLGKILGREKEAAEFNAFYEKELSRVRDGLKGITAKPRVFIEIHVGIRDDCCATMGDALMGRFIDWAGGHNVATEKLPGPHGLVSMEYLLTHQPDIYIATAIGAAGVNYPKPGRIVLGPLADKALAQESLAQALTRPGIAEFKAVKTGHAHAVWHNFYNTPLNVAAVQAFAKWIHPDRFTDLDPQKTLETLYDRFQPVPLQGTFWASAGTAP